MNQKLIIPQHALSPAAQEDISELEQKIRAFRNLELDEEKFRSFRLARGVYGQRQQGVQMIRIKLPYGKVSPAQLLRIAELSDEFASSNLHLTTRQDIQIHFVQLENSPKVWEELEKVGITLREACGNTVRNVTASAEAGIDPEEPFDVTPYAHAVFEYFLRNPICQEMGRKFKMAFSSKSTDSAFAFMHDLGFLPVVRNSKNGPVRGFKVLVGGGLGAQPFLAQKAFDFLETEKLIPFISAVLRVFDRHGERQKRHKARLKYLIQAIGLEAFMALVEKESNSVKDLVFPIDLSAYPTEQTPAPKAITKETPTDAIAFDRWKQSNVFAQKQEGFYGVYVRQFLGDLSSKDARVFADIVNRFASDDIRITVNQGWLLKYVTEDALAGLFNALSTIGLAKPGFDSTADITACPGTDTCNLGIASSTGLSEALENMMEEEFPDIVFNKNIKIKISGCMNACGQHTIGNIGFHGMSIKNGERVMPAMQVMLGGGVEPDGSGSLADKVIKLPTRRCTEAVRMLLHQYEEHGMEGEYFNQWYRRMVAVDKMHFYKMLKPLSETANALDLDYIDWGHNENYVTEVGVGECAGVMLDLVGTLLLETQDKLKWAERFWTKGAWSDAAYAAYATMVSGAKAFLTKENINCNTQIGIIRDFQEKIVAAGKFPFEGNFESKVLSINEQQVDQAFCDAYMELARNFVSSLKNEHYKTVEA
jgi:sulfite reductase (ferredoxin)